MNGVVFHTSVMMIVAKEPNWLPSGFGDPGRKPVSGETAKRNANAAMTVMIPYGMRIEVRTVRRPKTALCITRAKARPITSSIATETTVMMVVARTPCQKIPLDSTSA